MVLIEWYSTHAAYHQASIPYYDNGYFIFHSGLDASDYGTYSKVKVIGSTPDKIKSDVKSALAGLARAVSTIANNNNSAVFVGCGDPRFGHLAAKM